MLASGSDPMTTRSSVYTRLQITTTIRVGGKAAARDIVGDPRGVWRHLGVGAREIRLRQSERAQAAGVARREAARVSAGYHGSELPCRGRALPVVARTPSKSSNATVLMLVTMAGTPRSMIPLQGSISC